MSAAELHPGPWRTITGHRSPKFFVKWTELAIQLVGPHFRFSISEVRMPNAAGEASNIYQVRDAHTVTDAELRAGGRAKVIATVDTYDEAIAACEAALTKEAP